MSTPDVYAGAVTAALISIIAAKIAPKVDGWHSIAVQPDR